MPGETFPPAPIQVKSAAVRAVFDAAGLLAADFGAACAVPTATAKQTTARELRTDTCFITQTFMISASLVTKALSMFLVY